LSVARWLSKHYRSPFQSSTRTKDGGRNVRESQFLTALAVVAARIASRLQKNFRPDVSDFDARSSYL
jgi:hypothetical protein